MEWINTLTDSQVKVIEYVAIVASLLYVWLAARVNIWCWFFGLLSVVLYFLVFRHVKLYSEAMLQVFYMGMSVYGWWKWSSAHDRGGQLNEIKSLSIAQNIFICISGVVLAVLLGYFWEARGAELPWIDAATTSFSIIATFLVARKYIDNWIYWIIIDLVGAAIFWYKGLVPTSLLFLVYTAMAVYGWFKWKSDRLE